ncbi:regulator of chromosome condensation (RCC1) family protein [Citrus sinensis]|nr:regulator of chromosome condensation (RCC1) family protein [Citrus sinensis]
MAELEAEKMVEEETGKEKGGELLFCGSTCWDAVGRRKGALDGNLVSPTRLRPLVGVDIRFVAAGCVSCHCVAVDVEGRCYTWGRNERGQLGHGDKIQRDRPTIVSELSKYKIKKAGAGRSHTVVVTEDEIEPSPVRCLVSEVTATACGADFTVWLSSVEGASILNAGLPQYGQLGHGTDNEYNTKDSSVKLAYEAQPRPRAIAALAGETIVKVACGTNHTVAVDSKGYVYTWGFGGYGRLGHREQKDEWVPRRVDVFQRNNVLPPEAVISAGSVNSSCTAGNMHHFVGADSSCISWGHAQYGELGYGPYGQKSSAMPKKVDILEGLHVISVACGYGHSLVIVDRTNVGERLDQLDVYDGKASSQDNEEIDRNSTVPPKKGAAKVSNNSKKRKKSKDSSEEEEEEENSDYESDDSEEQANGQSERKKQAGGKASGRGRGKAANKLSGDGKGTGRGRGRPTSTNKSSQSVQGKTGKRGRPRKS